jgi:hypothetical protein
VGSCNKDYLRQKEISPMNAIRRLLGDGGLSMRWVARLSSLAISSVFLLILILAVTNEDKPHGPAIPVLVLLVLTMVACLAAWRWEKAGGVAVIVGSICLSLAAYSAAQAFGLGSAIFLPLLVYGAPFLVVGILFLIAGQRTAKEDMA